LKPYTNAFCPIENLPTKEIDCRTCCGTGYVNQRGMTAHAQMELITSDPCPVCRSGHGKETVCDYDAFERAVNELLLPGGK